MANWISLLDIIYPVGSLYMSTSSVSPSSIIGGTWTAVTTGATLLAAGSGYSPNNYGGSLTIARSQLPAHNHYVDGRSGTPNNPPKNAYVTLMPSWTTDEILRVSFNGGTTGKYNVMASTNSDLINNVNQTAFDGDGEDYHPYGYNIYVGANSIRDSQSNIIGKVK